MTREESLQQLRATAAKQVNLSEDAPVQAVVQELNARFLRTAVSWRFVTALFIRWMAADHVRGMAKEHREMQLEELELIIKQFDDAVGALCLFVGKACQMSGTSAFGGLIEKEDANIVRMLREVMQIHIDELQEGGSA
jgi:hypothetical protein